MSWVVIAGFMLAVALAIFRQQSAAHALCRELEQAQIESRRVAALKAELRRMELALPPRGKLEQMKADADELATMRGEVDKLRQQAETTLRAEARNEIAAKEKFRLGAEVKAT